MRVPKTIQIFKSKCYSVLLLFALAWLTVSLPFVYSAQQAQKEIAEKQHHAKTESGTDTNALTNTTEEKSESGVTTLSEYLHEVLHTEHPVTLIKTFYKCHPADLYLAFHPELICPPPDAFAS